MTTPTASNETAARDRRRASGADLCAALLSSSAWLDANAERINALNVFPVPDGDTGTNMSLTLQAAVDALRRLPAEATVDQVATAAYEASMLGARGNSGVILSQLLRGFSQALHGAAELTPELLAQALTRASEAGYTAVSHPVEGTILTVSRVAAAAAEQSRADLPDLLETALLAAADAVAETPNQLEVLRNAGVVDSGGEGYRVIVEGAWMWSTGRSLEEATDTRPYSRALLANIETDSEHSTFGFCTEFLLKDADVAVPDVQQRMQALGDSVIAVGDSHLLRVHVHTLRPGQALEFAVEHGTLAKVKVENMQLQHDAFAAASSQDDAHAAASSIGVIAVAAGEGLRKVFRSLGAMVVQGGQTMNPSVQEILSAVNSSGYKELIILPNNSNIVLTARRVKELTSHSVAVIATDTVPQGIGALLAFNFQSDLTTNVDAMQQALRAIHTLEITRAVRDAEVDGLQVQAGEYLSIYDGHVVAVRATPDEALLAGFVTAPVDALEIVTIYYGADATETDAHAIAARMREGHPALSVEVVSGGQPHYPYVVSLE